MHIRKITKIGKVRPAHRFSKVATQYATMECGHSMFIKADANKQVGDTLKCGLCPARSRKKK